MLLRCLLPCALIAGTSSFANPVQVPAAPSVVAANEVSLTSAPAPVGVQAPQSSLRPQSRILQIPHARWGTKNGRTSWTIASIRALRSHASILTEIVPEDIQTWCPAYPSSDRAGREAFWIGMVSSLAWHESTHRPDAVGGGGLWYGLVQILPDTARRYKCKAKTGAALKDPEDNLSCGFRIMATTVKRDMVVSRDWKGVAADWGPFHSKRKRHDMIDWTRRQDYCAGMASSPRPKARPGATQPASLMVESPATALAPAAEVAQASLDAPILAQTATPVATKVAEAEAAVPTEVVARNDVLTPQEILAFLPVSPVVHSASVPGLAGKVVQGPLIEAPFAPDAADVAKATGALAPVTQAVVSTKQETPEAAVVVEAPEVARAALSPLAMVRPQPRRVEVAAEVTPTELAQAVSLRPKARSAFAPGRSDRPKARR